MSGTSGKKDMRTPRAKVEYLGSAKSGTHDFWIQRLTAFAMIPLAIFAIASLVALVGADYATARAYLASPVVSILVILFIIAGIYHMRIGMQIIIEDYVHAPCIKTAALLGNTFFSFAVGLACIYAALRIGFGS